MEQHNRQFGPTAARYDQRVTVSQMMEHDKKPGLSWRDVGMFMLKIFGVSLLLFGVFLILNSVRNTLGWFPLWGYPIGFNSIIGAFLIFAVAVYYNLSLRLKQVLIERLANHATYLEQRLQQHGIALYDEEAVVPSIPAQPTPIRSDV